MPRTLSFCGRAQPGSNRDETTVFLIDDSWSRANSQCRLAVFAIFLRCILGLISNDLTGV